MTLGWSCPDSRYLTALIFAVQELTAGCDESRGEPSALDRRLSHLKVPWFSESWQSMAKAAGAGR